MLLVIEGFEGAASAGGGVSAALALVLLNKGHWCFGGGGAEIWSDAGRLAGVSFKDHANRGFALKYETSDNTVIIGFGYKATAWPGAGVARDIMSIKDCESNVHVLIQMYDVDEWRVVVPEGTYTTTNNSGGGAGWYYVELKIVISNTGSFELKIDEVSELDDSAIDTQANADGSSCFALFQSAFAWRWMDDIYICDSTGSVNNDFLGEGQVVGKFPDGDGSSSDFAPQGVGDNYVEVDEQNVDDDTTYSDGGTGDIDYYTYAAIAEDYVVRGVQINTTVRTTDAGSMSIKNKVRSGGIVADGEERFINVEYTTEYDIVIEDPNTDARWLVAGINAAEFGLEVQ